MRLTRRGDGALYDQVTAGFKANLSDVLAAIALVQLDRVEEHARIRQRQFALYDDGLAGLRGHHAARARRARHACPAPLRRADLGGRGRGDARRIPERSAEALIGTSIHFLPVHRLTWFRERYPGQEALAGRRAGG